MVHFVQALFFGMLLIPSSILLIFFNSESMKYYTEFQCEFHPFVHVSATPDAVVPIVSVSGTSSGTSSAPTRIKRKQERQVSHQKPQNIEPKTNKTTNTTNTTETPNGKAPVEKKSLEETTYTDTETDTEEDEENDDVFESSSGVSTDHSNPRARRGGVSLPPPPPLPTASRSDSRGRVPWIVGLVQPTQQQKSLEKYPGIDQYGFGFSFLGTVHHDGEVYRYCSPSLLQRTKTFSLLVDLHLGQLSLVADGKHLGVAFGPDSICTTALDSELHGRLIRKENMIPSFALGRHCLTKTQTGRLMATGTTHTDNRDNRDNRDSRESTPQSQQSQTTQHIQHTQHAQVPLHAEDNGSSARGKGGRRTSLFNQQQFQGLEALQQSTPTTTTTTIYNLPAISVNFGAYSFHHPIKGVSGFDSYLSFNEPNDVSELQDQRQHRREQHNNKTIPDHLHHHHHHHHRHHEKEMAAQCIRAIKDKVFFYRKWEPESVHSWSEYSPNPGVSHALEVAARRMQGFARQANGKKWRQGTRFLMYLNAIKVQRAVRRLLPKLHRKRKLAALQFQRRWRGVLGRKRMAHIRSFLHAGPAWEVDGKVTGSSVLLQAAYRMHVERKKYLMVKKRKMQALILQRK